MAMKAVIWEVIQKFCLWAVCKVVEKNETLKYFQCISIGDAIVFHWAVKISVDFYQINCKFGCSIGFKCNPGNWYLSFAEKLFMQFWVYTICQDMACLTSSWSLSVKHFRIVTGHHALSINWKIQHFPIVLRDYIFYAIHIPHTSIAK